MGSRLLKAGDQIGDWRIETPLGEGGMGAVYMARNAMSDRIKAAVKILKPHSLDDERDRFVREVEALYALRHPSIVRVTGWGEDEERGLLYLAMELVEGEELAVRIKRGAALSEDVAVRVFSELADGLRHAHERGIAHRDVKPANVMLTHASQPRLLDFGIAMAQGRTRLTSAGMAAGTMGYLPPETFSDEPLDPYLTDVYALGLTFYEALTGTLAFAEEEGLASNAQTAKLMAKKLRSKPFDPGSKFSSSVRKLIREATEPDPRKRLKTMRDFAVALGARPTETHLHSRRVAPVADTGGSTGGRSTSRVLRTGGVVVAAGGLGLLAVGLGLGVIGVGGGALWVVSASGDSNASEVSEPIALDEPLADKDEEDTGLSGKDASSDKADDGQDEGGSSDSDATSDKHGSDAATESTSTEKQLTPPRPTTTKPKTVTQQPSGRTYPITFASVPMGQKVYVDNRLVGTTPIAAHRIPEGRHTVRMEGTGGRVQRTITVGRRDPVRYVWKGGDSWESFF